jgi:hypothetical protein
LRLAALCCDGAGLIQRPTFPLVTRRFGVEARAERLEAQDALSGAESLLAGAKPTRRPDNLGATAHAPITAPTGIKILLSTDQALRPRARTCRATRTTRTTSSVTRSGCSLVGALGNPEAAATSAGSQA